MHRGKLLRLARLIGFSILPEGAIPFLSFHSQNSQALTTLWGVFHYFARSKEVVKSRGKKLREGQE
jgi:hypothetical protein